MQFGQVCSIVVRRMDLDILMAALAEPTRRDIFERLATRPRCVSELARDFEVTRPAVSQHLAVLKRAGLIEANARGTRHYYQISRSRFGQLAAWFELVSKYSAEPN